MVGVSAVGAEKEPKLLDSCAVKILPVLNKPKATNGIDIEFDEQTIDDTVPVIILLAQSPTPKHAIPLVFIPEVNDDVICLSLPKAKCAVLTPTCVLVVPFAKGVVEVILEILPFDLNMRATDVNVFAVAVCQPVTSAAV